MSLQERTIVVRNFDSEKTTEALLKELCLQAGPVRKVVLRPDHAFIEYDDIDSVGYSRALLDGIVLFGKILQFEPKLSRLPEHQRYTKALNDYIAYDRNQRAREQQRLHYEQQQQMQLQQQQLQLQLQQQQQQPQHLQYQQRMQMLFQQNQHPQAIQQQLYFSPPQAMPFNRYQTR